MQSVTLHPGARHLVFRPHLFTNELTEPGEVLVLRQSGVVPAKQVVGHVRREAFIQPQVRPVSHRHQVAKPGRHY